MTSSDIFEGINSVAQLGMAIAVAIGVAIAYRQLESWRSERQTIRKSELAEELIFIVSNIEDAFRNIRNPIDSIPLDKVDDKKFVYERRYQRIIDANDMFQRMREYQIRCDAVIGSDVTSEYVKTLFNARSEVAIAIEELSDLAESSDENNSEDVRQNKRILYGAWSDRDTLGTKILGAVNGLKAELNVYAQLSKGKL